MYVGFQLSQTENLSEVLVQEGNRIYQDLKQKVVHKLEQFMLADGSIDGSRMQGDWFPNIKADVFISHSHNDEKKALALAGWMYQKFGLTAFIDSCVWGYCNDLLKQIDDRYCRNESGDTYNYDLRNYSTSHVHMMLSTALTMMMDNTEMLLLLNTPSSISTNQAINQTHSPWIYHELATSAKLRKRTVQEHRIYRSDDKRSVFAMNESLQIKYDVPLNHLLKLTWEEVNDWTQEYQVKKITNPTIHPLDVLYSRKAELKLV